MEQTNIQRLRAGLCVDCDNKLNHGPYTDEDIFHASADIGMSAEDLEDVCDDCFVTEIARGDVQYAAHLLNRPVKLQNPGLSFCALLGVNHG